MPRSVPDFPEFPRCILTSNIYTFWEPRGKVLPYLKLCRRTWDVHLKSHRIIDLDHSNLAEHLDVEDLDLDRLKTLAPAVQKDVIMVAVLRQNGGIFMDMDTIALKEIQWIAADLEHSEIVSFDTHLAFMAARPNAQLLNYWYSGIRSTLGTLSRSDSVTPDLVGNRELDNAMTAMIRDSWLGPLHKLVGTALRSVRGSSLSDSPYKKLRHLLSRADSRLTKMAFSRTSGKYMKILSRDNFICESRYRLRLLFNPIQTYRDFWFGDTLETGEVVGKNQALIGLHNSWTPEWYKDLNEQEVLSHECMLSRVLAWALNGGGPS